MRATNKRERELTNFILGVIPDSSSEDPPFGGETGLNTEQAHRLIGFHGANKEKIEIKLVRIFLERIIPLHTEVNPDKKLGFRYLTGEIFFNFIGSLNFILLTLSLFTLSLFAFFFLLFSFYL